MSRPRARPPLRLPPGPALSPASRPARRSRHLPSARPTRSLRLALLAVLLSPLPTSRPAAAGDAPPTVLVVAPEGAKGPERGGGLAGLVADRPEDFEVRVRTRLDPAELEDAALVVLEARGDLDPGPRAELAEHVREGATLLIAGEALPVLSASPDGARLAGLEAPVEEPGPVLPLVVDPADQRAPVTQCVTPFLHRGRLPPAELGPDARVLARGLRRTRRAGAGPEDEPGVGPAPEGTDGRQSPSRRGVEAGRDAAPEAPGTPVLWTRAWGRGHVTATWLPARGEPSGDLVAALLARTAEEARDGRVRRPLAGDWRLAAEVRTDGARGVLPGLPPRRGHFLGREIAPVMGHSGADWLLRPSRVREERPGELLDRLEIRRGATVCDLGCGNGFFTLRLARRVGAGGQVLAVDIQEEMLADLRRRAEDAGVGESIRPILAREDDPRLPEGAVDLVLLADVYHELSRPRAVLGAVRRSLAPGGRVALVEYRGEDPTVPIYPLHRMTEAQARAEFEALGFRLKRVLRFLPRQHVLVFLRADAPRAEREGDRDAPEGDGSPEGSPSDAPERPGKDAAPHAGRDGASAP